MLLADIAFALEGFGTTYSLGDPADAAWMLSYALMGAALLHPSLIPQAPRPPLKFRPMPPGWVPPSPPAAPTSPASATAPTITQTQVLRYRVVLTWTGLALLALGGLGLLLAAGWNAPDLVMLAAAFGGMGSVILLSSAVR